tara:strand:- start:1343 stop:2974 length:1632 start_codon:yes stop_codon:yes gene_type:complete
METKPTIYSLEQRVQELEAQVTSMESHKLQLGYQRQILNDTQELSHIGSWNWDLLTNTIEWSDMMFRVLGLEPNEAVPSYDLAYSHIHDKDKEYYKKSLEESLNNKTPYYLENRVIKKDNTVISVISRGMCILNDNGDLVRMIGTVQDITEQKKSFDQLLKANKKAKEKETQLNEAQHIAKVGSWAYDPIGNRFQWSLEIYRIFGLDSQLKAPTYDDFKQQIHPEDWKGFDNYFKKAVKMGNSFESELRLLLDYKSEKWINIICQPIPKKTGKGYLLKGTIQDITTLKMTENKLINLNLSLEEKVMERTEELMHSLEREKKISGLKSNFVSITSHEFRTPLTIINLCSMLIEKNAKLGKTENIQEQVGKIRVAVINLVQILDDLLNIGRIEGGKVGAQKIPTDIKKLTQALLTEIGTISKQDQNLIYTHQGTTDTNIDVNLYGGIFLNLITNAIKYSEKDIKITTKHQGHNLVIEVEDSGIGIPLKEQNKIFSQYFRATNAIDIAGTGLGLNIVHQYVQLLEGSIEFTSIPNKGTTFIVVLPS